MTITVKRDFSSKTGMVSTKKTEYREGWILYSTTTQTSIVALQTALGITPYSTTFADDATAYATKIDWDQGDETATGGEVWTATVTYSTLTRDPDQEDEDPLNRPMIRTWGAIEYDTYPFRDATDVPIVNTAGQMFRDSVPIPLAMGVLTIVRNEATFDYRDALFYSNRTNTDVFYGADPDDVLCKPIRATEKYENGVNFAEVQYEFHFGRPGKEDHKAVVLNHGNYYIDADGKEVLPEDEVSGVQYSDVILMDIDSMKLTKTQIATGNSPPLHYLKFRKYETTAFAPLNLE